MRNVALKKSKINEEICGEGCGTKKKHILKLGDIISTRSYAVRNAPEHRKLGGGRREKGHCLSAAV